MEYIQTKTAWIEAWERELLIGATHSSDLLTQYLEYNNNNNNKQYDPAIDASLAAGLSAADKQKVTAAAAAKSSSASEVTAVSPPCGGKRKNSAAVAAAAAAAAVGSAGDNSDEDAGEGHVHRKSQHNAVEKRRRDRINVTINELKDLVPSCKAFNTNKAAVLHHASEYIRQITRSNSELQLANQRLQESNTHLQAELTELHRLLWSVHQSQNQPQPSSLPASALLPPSVVAAVLAPLPFSSLPPVNTT